MLRTSLCVLLAGAALFAGCRSTPETMRAKMPSTPLSVIPRPTKIETAPGTFLLTAQTRLIVPADTEAARVARYSAAALSPSGATPLRIEQAAASGEAGGAIVFMLDRALQPDLGSEGYLLLITPQQVKVSAVGPAGLFYGVQTIRQLLPPEVYGARTAPVAAWSVPCARILDVPRFSWRGMHLDVSRHFFGKEFVKQYIDLLAMNKMNMFHWHLTDDQGWRLEIKRYPRLTSVGAWRVDRENESWEKRKPQEPGEKATYGGYYTQDDVREVVAYARERFVTVVPEIEMPGHSVATLAAYPEYSCTGGPFTVRTGGYWPNVDILCAGNDSTFTFLQNVLTEVVDLFPSPFVHIGGDEADKTNWKKCPKCQARIKAEGLKDEEELQSYFIRRVEKILNAKGKRLIGWDEILQGGLAPNATVMSWRGMEGGVTAARANHDVVMTPTSYCYFDYYQAKSGEPPAIGGFLPLDTVYSFEPMPAGLAPEQQKHILGAQGNLWTEFVPTPSQAEYMVLPRMSALAEVVWTKPELKDYDDFLARLNRQNTRWDQMGVNYRSREARAARP